MDYNRGKNYSAAGYCVNARDFADAEKNPDGIKDRLQNPNDKRFRCGDVFHSDIENKITHAYLENTHVQQNQELGCVQPHVRENQGQADCSDQQVAENYCHDCVFMAEILFPFQEQGEKGETDSRADSNKVAVKTTRLQFFHEEQHHSRYANNYCD